MKSKADKRKHLKACSERAPPAPELCQAIPNAAGHRGRSRPQRPQQAVPGGGTAGTEERWDLPSRLRGDNGPGQRARGPSRGRGGSPPVRQEVQPHARRRAAASPVPLTARPRSQPGSPSQPGPPHTLAPPRTAKPPPTARPGVAAAGPSDLKMAPLTSRRRRRPPGLAERGARWERCRGDGRAR